MRLDAVPANVFRPDVAAAFPSFSAAHGYRDVVAVSPGPHTLCMIGEGATVGPPVGLGCRSI